MRHQQTRVDNSLVEAFASEAALIVEQWNQLNAEEARGKFVLRVEGGEKDWPEKRVCLLADTGLARPREITLLLVELEEGELVGSNPLLPLFEKQPVTSQRLQFILENMDLAILRNF